ncbi:MAG: homoserine dehydrogenase [bacterium]
MQQIRLGIAGLGTVACGVLEIIAQRKQLIAARGGVEIVVSRVASRTAKPEVNLLGASFSTDLNSLLADDVDMVVELIGGEGAALELIGAATRAGKLVVTANKAVIAKHGNELQDLRNNIAFEAAVAGAIPIIASIERGLIANQFEHVMGIINGTCNYILTAMKEEGAGFADALARAQALGYAEADPTFDIEGIDAAHKLAILLGLAFDQPFNFADLHVEGISRITADDIRYADELGYRIKHLGIARQVKEGIEARVHPTLVPNSQLLAHVDGVMNAVLVKCDAAGDTLYSGPGAGGSATASAVLSDVVSLAQRRGSNTRIHTDSAQIPVPVLPMAQVRTGNYLRIPTKDEPGVFAKVAQALSQHGISIEAAIQKEPKPGQATVAIVMLTQMSSEADIEAAMDEVRELPQVAGEIVRIRVESFD